MLDDSEIQRVLVINAHPDDVDFSAAGTIALWTDAGIEVTYCIVTDGDAGGHDESVPRSGIAPVAPRRADRRRQACGRSRPAVPRLPRRQGGSHPRAAPGPRPGHPAGFGPTAGLPHAESATTRRLPASPPRSTARWASAVRWTPSTPTPATRSPSRRLLADEGLKPWTVCERSGCRAAPPPATTWTSPATFPRKGRALRAHESQTGRWRNLEEFLRGWLTRPPPRAACPRAGLAEAFQVLNTG
jgi:LmbE family N-acetylglucosaminyl deacetylase